MRHRISIVGLGPADERLLTSETRAILLDTPIDQVRFRTRIHPAAAILPTVATFDHVYEQEATFDEVYRRIVEELVQLADSTGQPLVYAVPGSPVVAEHTVELLLRDPRFDAVVHPAMSFLDLAWAKLRIDPVASGVRLIDGHRFADDAARSSGAALVGQCHDRSVLSDIKLSIDDALLDRAPTVTVLHHLGLADERIVAVEWHNLDRLESEIGLRVDHLSSLYIPELISPTGRAFVQIEQQMRILREECPWDREQTHSTLARYAVEEAYELVDAIDVLSQSDDADAIEHVQEELGDLLLQVVFHACLAEEEGWFTFADVAVALHEKLERRHPHVFGDVVATTTDDVESNWAAIKAAERSPEGANPVESADPFADVPDALPALSWASKIVKRAAARGHEPTADGSLGDRLLALVVDARQSGLDPEVELRRAAGRLKRRVLEAARSTANYIDESKRT